MGNNCYLLTPLMGNADIDLKSTHRKPLPKIALSVYIFVLDDRLVLVPDCTVQGGHYVEFCNFPPHLNRPLKIYSFENNSENNTFTLPFTLKF